MAASFASISFAAVVFGLSEEHVPCPHRFATHAGLTGIFLYRLTEFLPRNKPPLTKVLVALIHFEFLARKESQEDYIQSCLGQEKSVGSALQHEQAECEGQEYTSVVSEAPPSCASH